MRITTMNFWLLALVTPLCACTEVSSLPISQNQRPTPEAIPQVSQDASIRMRNVPELNLVEDSLQPNQLSASDQPTDPAFHLQWSHEMLNATSIPSSNKVVVAVIDSGIRTINTNDLKLTNIHPLSKDFTVTGETLGNIQRVHEFSLASQSRHGSHIAAVFLQIRNNGIGAKPLLDDVSVMVLNVLKLKEIRKNNVKDYFELVAEPEIVANAIIYAVENGADIINLSLASYTKSDSINDAIQFATERNTLVVVAAGNEGGRRNSELSYELEGKIVVGSVNSLGLLSSFSNNGEVEAPGGEIPLSEEGIPISKDWCIPVDKDQEKVEGIVHFISEPDDDGWEEILLSCSGTSIAAALTSGVAASVESILKQASIESPILLESIIKSTASEVQGTGVSIVNAGAAVGLAQVLVSKEFEVYPPAEQFLKYLRNRGGMMIERGIRDKDISYVKKSLELFEDIDSLNNSLVGKKEWNEICWVGGLLAGLDNDIDYLDRLLPICEQAIEEAGPDPSYHYAALDSKMVVNILRGQTAQARDDLEKLMDAVSNGLIRKDSSAIRLRQELLSTTPTEGNRNRIIYSMLRED